jgi:hypothetical protein
MTSGDLIQLRLQQKRCIKCGLTAAIDWPYVCDACLKALAKSRTPEPPDEKTTHDPKV